MKILIYPLIILFLWPVTSFAGKRTPVQIIAREPVTMMDLGILKLNAHLSRPKYPGLHGATMVAKYNVKHGTIDIKVSKPVTKASRSQCRKLIANTKKIFVRPYGKKQVSNIHHYFHHEGTSYSQRINWHELANYVVITGIVLTKKNYQDSIYCQSKLMKKKVSYK
ncbi:MAG: hypothetical protein PVG20_05155 [Thioalkalispiraceae bacterium]|jgi:hypothetical protein